MASITCDGRLVKVDGLSVEDPGLADLLRSHPDDRWEELVGRALAVGARGLLTMGLGIDLGEVDARVRRSMEEVTSEAQRSVEGVLAAAEEALAERFDPERRASVVARALEEFAAWRDDFLHRFDPDHADSHSARFLTQLEGLLGPHGDLELRLRQVLDPDADGSALARLSASMDRRLTELRDLILTERGRAEEASKGTAKGIGYEEVVEERLRTIALAMGGCVVERTGRTAGELGSQCTVGDFVVILPTGQRLVVEAKNTARIGLSGKDGILAELDQALANRAAQLAVCVSREAAFPHEVGVFGVYGNRLLVVDDGEGTMLSVALRWGASILQTGGVDRPVALDTGLVFDRLQRLRNLAQHFSTARRSLTEVKGSLEGVQGSLDAVRTELLELVDELTGELQRSCSRSD